MNELLANYLTNHSSAIPSYLSELERLTHLRTRHPQMLSGQQQGRLLSIISKLAQPSHILELGTFTGYSALCLAEGLNNNGKLTTIDDDAERNTWVQSFIQSTPYANQIECIIKPAVSYLESNSNSLWDLVFIDADKLEYPTYYHLIKNKIKSGGLLIADNVLWYHKVIDPNMLAKDRASQQLDAFNKLLSSDHSFDVNMFDIRDGLTIAIKK